jgi:flavodoxin
MKNKITKILKTISPKNLYAILQNEYDQTLAYIISFAFSKSYCRKFLKCCTKEQALHIMTYLQYNHQLYSDQNMIDTISEYITNNKMYYTSMLSRKKYTGNDFISLTYIYKVKIVQDILKNIINDKQNIKSFIKTIIEKSKGFIGI